MARCLFFNEDNGAEWVTDCDKPYLGRPEIHNDGPVEGIVSPYREPDDNYIVSDQPEEPNPILDIFVWISDHQKLLILVVGGILAAYALLSLLSRLGPKCEYCDEWADATDVFGRYVCERCVDEGGAIAPEDEVLDEGYVDNKPFKVGDKVVAVMDVPYQPA